MTFIVGLFGTIFSGPHRKTETLKSVPLKKSEAVVRRCSVKKVFLEISQNSQENTCTRVSFLNKVAGCACKPIKWCFPVNFAKFLRNFSFYKTALVAASHKMIARKYC